MAVNPMLAIAALQTGAGIIGALSNKGGNAPPVDYSSLIAQINASKDQDSDRILAGQKELEKFLPEYQKKVGETQAEYEKRVSDLKKRYTTEQDALEKAKDTTLSDALKRRILGALPEIQRNTRRQLASTGGLNRGAATLALTGNTQKAIRELTEGQTQIELGKQATRQQVLDKLMSIDEAAINNYLNTTRADLAVALQTGRQDVIDKVNALLDSAQSANANIASLTGQQIAGNYNRELARQAARTQGKNDLTQAIIQGLGTVGQAYYGQPRTSAPSVSTGNNPYMAGQGMPLYR